ncbi:MAG: hypothetical protein EBR82_72950 [Caulobacteraceae bacterium]|nr:hypothetical protein [Caulobacteraceae bacterium]
MIEEMTMSDLAMVLVSRVEEEGLSNVKISLQSPNDIVWTVKVDAVSLKNQLSGHSSDGNN